MAVKKKKNYNEILYELQKQAVLNKTGTSDEELRKQAAKQEFAQLKSYAPITKNNVVSNTYAKTSNKTKQDDGKKWYQKIVEKPEIFDDNEGFWDNAGDIAQSILGSTVDVVSDVIKAPVRIGEGIGDALNYGIAGLIEPFNDEKADKIRKKATINLTDKWFSGVDKWTDKSSVFGDTIDSIAEGVGYATTLYATGGLASSAGLGAAGTTAVTSGLTATSGFGSGTSQAYQSGATDDEAYAYGLIAGLAEAGTELMFGGIAKGSKALGISKGAIPIDDMLAKKTTEKMTNQLVKNFTQYGIKAGAEGFEEVAAGFLQALGKKATYMSEEELSQIIEDEELFEQFVVGAVSSGITQAPGLVSSNKMGVDFVQTESDTQKNISKQIQDLESQLDTSMNANQQQEVLNQINTLKTQYDAETQNINKQKAEQEQAERELRRTNFTYDTTKITDEFESGTYESASRVANNTERSHEFIPRVAKLAKDTQTYYEFTNNEELANNKYEVKDRIVDGLLIVEQDGKEKILINLDSPRALNVIAGHEATHLFEGTQEYKDLQKALFRVAETKGELETRRNQVKELYKNVNNANIDNELTSMLAGDYLFTDSKFINSLAVEKPNLFQKIKELIDDLVVRFTGTKEEKQLREAQKLYKEVLKNKPQSINNKVVDENGNPITFNRYHKDAANLSDDYDYSQSKAKHETGFGYTFIDDNSYIEGKDAKDVIKSTITAKNGLLTETDNIVPKEQIDKLNQISDKYIPGEVMFGENMTEAELIDAINKASNIIAEYEDNNNAGRKAYVEFYNAINKDGYMKINPNGSRLLSVLSRDSIDSLRGNEIKYSFSEAGTHGDLMAIHNLSEEKMKGVIELGGFPVPSIAVTNPSKVNFTDYGNISVLFDKNTIDPVNVSNEVYGSDVYSPRFPQTVQKINEKELSKLESYLGENLYLEDTTLDETVQKNRYTKKFINKFAEENNITVADVYKDSGFNYTFSTDENVRNFVIDNDITYEKLLNNNELRNKFYDLYKEGSPLKGLAERKIETFEKIFNEQGNNNNSTAERLNSDFDAIKNGSEKIKDDFATEKALRDKVLSEYEEQYTNFLTDKFAPVFEDKYIRNNKDLFTPAGNRRSFKQLHEPYNLENVVKNMKGKVRGEEGFFYGAGNIRSQVTPQFKSIAEIKANEGKLVTTEQMEEVKQDINSDLNNLSVVAKNFGGYSYDSYEAALNEIASLKKITPAKARSIFSEYGFNNVPDILVDKSIEFLEKLKNAPTEYFEAKPQRAVGLNEVQAIVIPNDSSVEFKQLLQDNGIKYYEYDPTIEGDRQRVINQFDDLKFSLSQQGQDIAPTGDYNVYGKDIKLQVEEAIAPLQEKIETLTEHLDTVVNATEQVSTQPTKTELDNLMVLQEKGGTEYANEFFRLRDKYGQPKLYKGINEYKKAPDTYGTIEEGKLLTEADLDEFYNQSNEVFKTITDEDAPMPMEDASPDYDYEKPKVESPLYDRDIEEVGNRKVKAYQYEHPEVRPYFQEAALGMMYDLDHTTKGERIYNDEVYYNTNGEEGWMGIKRNTTDDIADLLDNFNYSYADIRKGLEAIIEDNGAENIAVAKRIEFALDDRLRNGYTAVDGLKMPANQEYIDLLRGKEFTDYYNSIPSNDIAPIEENLEQDSVIAPETKNVAENALKSSHEEIVTKPETTKEIKQSTNPIKPKEKGSTRDTLNYLFINRNEAIDRFAKETGNNNIKFLADHVNNVSGEISTNINKAQIDNNGRVIGKSIVDIFNQARDAKLTEAFEDYLFHLSNKARHKQGKGSLVPLTESKALIIEYEKAYPEMKKWAREVNKYNKQNLYKQVEADLYSKEFADGLVEKYEFYVPFFADVLKTYVPSKTNGIKTRGTVRLAEGGANRNLLSFEEAMIRQTQMAITAIRKNQLYQEIVDSSPQVALGNDADANGLYVDENGYYLTAKVNGENVSAYISEDLYKGLENKLGQEIRNIEQKLSGITKPLQFLGNIRRNILTTWSPSFIITNPAKDIQDAPLNSKYAKDWAINYPIAFKELATGKGEHIQEFLNMYGQAGIMGDYVIDSGISDATKIAKTKKKLAGITRLNEMLELAPRYAEYLASLKNGTSQMEALYNAREVTTNFGRGGVITKALNRNGFTFLNASVQGFNKLYRNFSGENGAKGVVNASLKAIMFGVVPALFNALAYDDDEDYEALPDYIKDNYYLYKTDDGEFIRIPKGRMMSIFGSAARRALEATQGEENAFEGYLTNAYSQVGIQNPLESNIFAPLIQAYGSEHGKTWYGTDLVPTRLQDVPTAEQYDESTDKFSIWLGETFGISPYKVNYVFDQYSGGIGDLLLPTITEEANSDGSFLAPLQDKFVVNSTMDNKYASEFYTKRDKLQVNANSMYATEQDKLMSMYMDEVSWDMSSLYKEKREVQNSDLSKAEKYEKVQEIQNQINELAKEALNTYDTGKYTDNYVSIGNYEFYKGTDYNGNEEWKTVYDYKVEELEKLGMTSEEKNEYFALKQEFDALNNEYYDNKDDIEKTYGKRSDEYDELTDKIYLDKKNKIIDNIMASGLTDDAKAYLYKEYYSSSAMDTITMSGIPVDYILDYEKNDFKADYNSKGEAIANSRKNKVIDYVNQFDLSIPEKAIIIKSTNTFKFNDYNDAIVEYVSNLDIGYEDKVYILEELDMTVRNDGYVVWE